MYAKARRLVSRYQVLVLNNRSSWMEAFTVTMSLPPVGFEIQCPAVVLLPSPTLFFMFRLDGMHCLIYCGISHLRSLDKQYRDGQFVLIFLQKRWDWDKHSPCVHVIDSICLHQQNIHSATARKFESGHREQHWIDPFLCAPRYAFQKT